MGGCIDPSLENCVRSPSAAAAHTDLEGLKNVQKLKTDANYKTNLKYFIHLTDEYGPKFNFFHLNMTM